MKSRFARQSMRTFRDPLFQALVMFAALAYIAVAVSAPLMRMGAR